MRDKEDSYSTTFVISYAKTFSFEDSRFGAKSLLANKVAGTFIQRWKDYQPKQKNIRKQATLM